LKHILPTLVLTTAGVAAAADPSGFAVWNSAGLKAKGQELSTKLNEKKAAGESLGKFGNHATALTHRQASGDAELHENQVDMFVVQSGEATLVVGGEIVDIRNVAPGEFLGKSIRNGVQHKLAAGDIVHIPARTPHQLLIEAGKEFTYFVVKVDAK
jgi:mannose-6-phosphate isomerase-like protein (cupin superfamily)